jgi:hypothetical protein
MAVGGFLGIIGVPLPGTEIGIALSGVLLGAVVLLERRPPLYWGRSAGGNFRSLSRSRSRCRVAAGWEWLTLQLGLRDRHRCSASDRHRRRAHSSLAQV